MRRNNWLVLVPSMMIGLGIVAATYVAGLSWRSSWMSVEAAALMGLAIVGAESMQSKMGEAAPRTSWGAFLLGSGLVLSSVICCESRLMSVLIPIIGAAAWILFMPDRKKACRAV